MKHGGTRKIKKLAASGVIYATLWSVGTAEPLLRIEHAVITRQAEADHGTAHVYVHNRGEKPIGFESVSLTGDGFITEPDPEGSTLPYLWWRCWPDPVPPGGYGDLMVKLARTPTRKLALTFRGPEKLELESTVNRINDDLGVTSVGFTPGLDEMFVYVENRTEGRLAFRAATVNGDDCTSRSRLLPVTVPPLGKACLKVCPAEAFAPGTFLFVRVRCEPEAQAVVLTRAFHAFPITWLDGSLPDGLDAGDAEAASIRPGTVPREGLAGIENIMRCPAHAHGTRREAAAEFIARHARLSRTEPGIPGMIYVCRWEKEMNYFVFAELADFVRVMPWAGSLSYVPAPFEHRCQWLTALAVRAAAPRPVHAVVPVRFEDSLQWDRSLTPEEVRALVYLPLSRGAKGLCYGRRDPGLTRPAEDELARTTREVATIRESLAFAEPFPLAHTDRPRVEAASLLAGDRAVVLLLINHGFEDFDNGRILQSRPEASVRIEIELPGQLRVRTVRDLREPSRPVTWSQQQDAVTLRAEDVSVVRPYLILFSRDARQTKVPSSLVGPAQ